METVFLFLFDRLNLIVLTVPMRNGNLSNKIKIPLDAPVLTVPMRNGNSDESKS